MTKPVPSCGYVQCACSTCFDVAVCSAPVGQTHKVFSTYHLCLECEEAGCDEAGDEDCKREGQYEDEDEQFVPVES